MRTTKPTANLVPIYHCGMHFVATFDNCSEMTWKAFVAMLYPPMDTDLSCKSPMCQYLVRNDDERYVEGAFLPSCVQSGLAFLMANCRAVDFYAVCN